MSRSSAAGLLRVTLVTAQPAPPWRGRSAWTLRLTDAEGVPVSADTVIALSSRMPDHGHGTPLKPVIVAGDAPGTFMANPVYLFMAGYWVTTINVTLPDGKSDSARFAFLIGDEGEDVDAGIDGDDGVDEDGSVQDAGDGGDAPDGAADG
jgi:hypothetical protein